jgi:hypothetical protein
VLQLLYDADVLSEEAIEAWAEAKAEDAEEDQEYLRRVRARVSWCVDLLVLKCADSIVLCIPP